MKIEDLISYGDWDSMTGINLCDIDDCNKPPVYSLKTQNSFVVFVLCNKHMNEYVDFCEKKYHVE